MNNTTLLKLINSTYDDNQKIYKNTDDTSMYKHLDFFQLMGGYKEDFSKLFGKLNI